MAATTRVGYINLAATGDSTVTAFPQGEHIHVTTLVFNSTSAGTGTMIVTSNGDEIARFDAVDGNVQSVEINARVNDITLGTTSANLELNVFLK